MLLHLVLEDSLFMTTASGRRSAALNNLCRKLLHVYIYLPCGFIKVSNPLIYVTRAEPRVDVDGQVMKRLEAFVDHFKKVHDARWCSLCRIYRKFEIRQFIPEAVHRHVADGELVLLRMTAVELS